MHALYNKLCGSNHAVNSSFLRERQRTSGRFSLLHDENSGRVISSNSSAPVLRGLLFSSFSSTRGEERRQESLFLTCPITRESDVLPVYIRKESWRTHNGETRMKRASRRRRCRHQQRRSDELRIHLTKHAQLFWPGRAQPVINFFGVPFSSSECYYYCCCCVLFTERDRPCARTFFFLRITLKNEVPTHSSYLHVLMNSTARGGREKFIISISRINTAAD